MDELDLLRWQFTLPFRLAQHHLPHLRDDEACLWAPAPGAWTVRRDERGDWRPDWSDQEPDPAPAVTIGWLTWHLIWWMSDLMSAVRNQPQRAREECLWPGSAVAATARINALLADWRSVLDGLAASDLTRPVSYPWREPRELRQVIAWANVELMKNISEIGVLRHAFEASRR